jgi:predicted MPP superfamily phosphohydrolase
VSRFTTRTRRRHTRYHRAWWRHLFLTHAPDRITFGRLRRRLLETPIEIRQIEIHSPLWPRAFDGLRIGHLSDLHLGTLMPVERAHDALDRLAEQKPDLLACTGDVVDLHARGVDAVFEHWAQHHPALGSWLVLGNHDELDAPDEVARVATTAGIEVLEDREVVLERDGERLVVGGIGWSHSTDGCSARLARLDGEAVQLLLSHNPRVFPSAARRRIALTLAGHTHGGQIASTRDRNRNLAVAYRHSAGCFELGKSRLFVTAGLGAWFPLRVNCPPEIAVITMRSGPDPTP